MTDIFCQLYDTWQKDGKIIFENEGAYAILSVTPATPGHAIVVSRPHVERLEELRGAALEQFVDAIAAAAASVRGSYDDPERLVRFYEQLKEAPPAPAGTEPARQMEQAAQRMLAHRHLRVRPDTAYNVGINVGGYAGQSVNHLHAQVFPRREKGLGIVSAMQLLLDEQPQGTR